MNETLVIARKKFIPDQSKTQFRLRLNEGQSDEIVFTEAALDLLKLNNKDVVMFSFCRAGNYGYIYKEEELNNNYVIHKRPRQKGATIHNNGLTSFFRNTFIVKNERVTHYELTEIPDKKGRFKFTQKFI